MSLLKINSIEKTKKGYKIGKKAHYSERNTILAVIEYNLILKNG